MWIPAVQDKWGYPSRQTKPSLQDLWSPACSPPHSVPRADRGLYAGGTLVVRETLHPRDLPCCGCEHPVAHGLCERPLDGIARPFVCAARNLSTCGDHSRLDGEADDMCSFVEKQLNKPWPWLAMDTTMRQVTAFYGGHRSRKSAAQLWANIPVAYREQATCYTGQYEAYQDVIPAAQHKAITKNARNTNHIERFHNTRRPRVSHLFRDTFAFSKELEYHIGAIRYFICHDNLTRAAAVLVSHYQIPHMCLAPQGAGSSEWLSKICGFNKLCFSWRVIAPLLPLPHHAKLAEGVPAMILPAARAADDGCHVVGDICQ
jgi:insertion element IS1 protein InsB